ncbi:MAG: hypothetical protein ALECFALPRED_007688 [Alectoria fallacina]|uniref:DUF7514 domain-containing protein n=1 Tax=Alectoria fallacina TaxID=1903189 RepID=A0A8H3PE28_9LECA|nr:MAG: hypothetical protein ALECFALPRED_007688 [Alectoria fallacina]
MASTAVAAQEYWGYLIKPDKSPTPVFELLLLGVANYINKHIAPWDIQTLTPAKLAAFYRLVGGDYDPLFLETSQASLSFIYQSLGCYHTLQPEKDPHTPPTIPALTPAGFVRWQTVQLLLEPEEHVPFLQEAVKRFDLTNPVDGAPFPSILPKESLPCQPDMVMVEWHESVAEKLMLEAQASAARAMPPRPNLALSDIDLESSRDTSSVDSHSVVDAAHGAGYFNHPRANDRGPQFVHVPYRLRPSPRYLNQEPWSPERRRSSLPDDRAYPSSWPREGPTPTSYAPPPPHSHPHPHPHHHHHVRPHHARIPSDISISSSDTSDTSSITTSSASMSPVRYHAQINSPSGPSGLRRHSTIVPPQRPASHPQGYSPHQRQPTGPSASKAKNVRWQDMDDVFDAPRHDIPRNRSMDLRSRGDPRAEYRMEDRRRGARSVAPMTGVGGRRYAPSWNGMDWR